MCSETDNYFEMDCACKGKNLDKLMQPAILEILYNRKLHGFMIVRKLAESPTFGGSYPDKAGVYRYLKKMENSGLLASEWEFDSGSSNPRRVYSITDKGKDCLRNWGIALTEYEKSISALVKEILKVTG